MSDDITLTPKSAEMIDADEAREALLREELERLVQVATRQLHPKRIIVFGSLAANKVREWSDLDVVIIAETDRPFYERSKEVIKEVRPRVGLDLLVYSPAEWKEIQARPFIREEVVKKGRIVYGQ